MIQVAMILILITWYWMTGVVSHVVAGMAGSYIAEQKNRSTGEGALFGMLFGVGGLARRRRGVSDCGGGIGAEGGES